MFYFSSIWNGNNSESVGLDGLLKCLSLVFWQVNQFVLAVNKVKVWGDFGQQGKIDLSKHTSKWYKSKRASLSLIFQGAWMRPQVRLKFPSTWICWKSRVLRNLIKEWAFWVWIISNRSFPVQPHVNSSTVGKGWNKFIVYNITLSIWI